MAEVEVHSEQKSIESPPSVSERVRICHVSLTLATGGLERLLADFARLHNREQFDLSFMAFERPGHFADEIRGHGCPVHLVQATTRLKRIKEMKQFFQEQQFDLVHTHNTYPMLYATPAARWARVRANINTRHGQGLRSRWKERAQYRWTSRLVNRIVTVSEDAARIAADSDGVSTKRLQRIWNGIDLENFAYHGPKPVPVGITVARLAPEKDFPTLLKAVPLVLEKVPDFRLEMVGDGKEREKLESLVKELGIESAVIFHGEQQNVPKFLEQAGFYISSSISEGISLTILEAMASGLPVIGTDVGGNPEIIEDGLTGRIVPPADPEALAASIIYHCQNQEFWEEMAFLSRARVEKYFDIRRMIQDYEQLYLDLLKR